MISLCLMVKFMKESRIKVRTSALVQRIILYTRIDFEHDSSLSVSTRVQVVTGLTLAAPIIRNLQRFQTAL